MSRNIKICVVCGKPFYSPPSDKTVTCSRDCSSIHRSRTHKGVSNSWSAEKRKKLSSAGQTQNLKLGTPAALISPSSGHYETNTNAKVWHVVSPEGKHYRFRNLNLWAEQNYELFGFDNISDSRRVVGGIKTAKRGAEGKIKASTYKGWSVVIDADQKV